MLPFNAGDDGNRFNVAIRKSFVRRLHVLAIDIAITTNNSISVKAGTLRIALMKRGLLEQ
jgi:hypothetical protein